MTALLVASLATNVQELVDCFISVRSRPGNSFRPLEHSTDHLSLSPEGVPGALRRIRQSWPPNKRLPNHFEKYGFTCALQVLPVMRQGQCEASNTRSQAERMNRTFLRRAYPTMKRSNPETPILIRECTGIQPKMWARYGIFWRENLPAQGR